MSGSPPPETAPPRLRRALFAVVSPLQTFFRTEAAGGVVLLVNAVLALGWASSPWAHAYHTLFSLPLVVGVGSRVVTWSLHHVINDALMAVFFLVAGMEIKRELSVGELRTLQRASLPLLAAVGGMVVPALLYAAITREGPPLRGWGVPMATDIAFALGCLSLVRSRVPRSLFVFLTALAIFDDLGAILVIALFYGGSVSWAALGVAALLTGLLIALAWLRVSRVAPYLFVGFFLWLAILRSGIHATVAGVILGLCLPARARRPQRDVLRDIDGALDSLRADDDREGSVAALERHLEAMQSPLDRLLHGLHVGVAFGIVPLFALANAGVSLRLDAGQAFGPVTVGSFVGLALGKPLGVFGATWLALRLGLAPRPTGASLLQIAGVAALAGIGFTMSLFIGGLAFADHPRLVDNAKIGVLAASFVSATIGLLVLRSATPPNERASTEDDDHRVLVDDDEHAAGAR